MERIWKFKETKYSKQTKQTKAWLKNDMTYKDFDGLYRRTFKGNYTKQTLPLLPHAATSSDWMRQLADKLQKPIIEKPGRKPIKICVDKGSE